MFKVPLQFFLDLQTLPEDNPQAYVNKLIEDLAAPPSKRPVGRPSKRKHPHFTDEEFEVLVPVASKRIKDVYNLNTVAAKGQGGSEEPTILMVGDGRRFVVDFGPDSPFNEVGGLSLKFPPGVEELT